MTKKYSENKIYRTSNINFLKSIKYVNGNRSIKKRKKLYNDIKLVKRIDYPITLIFNKDDNSIYVADGQHRLDAVKKLYDEGIKISVPYIFNNNLTLERIRTNCNLAEKWDMKDFIESSIELENENYIRLYNMANRSKMLAMSDIAALLNGYSIDTPVVRNKLKDGTFKINEECVENTEYVIDITNEIKDLIDELRKNEKDKPSYKELASFSTAWKRAFVLAVQSCNYDHEKMLSKLRGYYISNAKEKRISLDRAKETVNFIFNNGDSKNRKELF